MSGFQTGSVTRPEAPSPSARQRGTRMIAIAIGSVTLSVLPSMLIGALAVLIRPDLGLTETQLGTAVSGFYAAWVLTAVRGGRIAERLGARRAMAVAALGSAAALLGVAILASSWLSLFLLLAAAGCANSLAQPATNLGLAREVPARRLGLAFGVKQTNGPVATMIAGLSLPAIGLTLGWRWAFGLLAVTALAFAAVTWRPREAVAPHVATGSTTRRRVVNARLVVLAAAAAAGVAASTALITFYVESVVTMGASEAAGGIWFAVGSGAGTGARVLWGWVADRRLGESLTQVIVLALVGAVSFAALPFAGTGALLAVVTVIAFGAGWGWFGLFLLSVVRSNEATPGVATGVVNVGVALGGVVGPPGFGALVQLAGYPVAWAAAAAALVVTAVLCLVAHRFFAEPAATQGSAA